jgi:hypothetical protein
MASSTYSGVTREVPILAYDVASGSILVRGMVVEWDAGTQMVRPWTSGTIVPLGVCTGDADNRVLLVDVYCAKGCSVLIKCAEGIVPEPNDWLFWGGPGLASNSGIAGQQFARAIWYGMNGYVEAIIS